MLNSRRVLMTAVLLFAVPAFSQNCALCYTRAASNGGKLIAALRSGIVVLIVPPMFMSVGVTWLAYKKNNHFGSGEQNQIQEDQESKDLIDRDLSNNKDQ
jgi:hypothetical protein